ncbi:MAG: ribonuclease III family protein [Candidatus Heimdallarchaeaceae archaeon]
MYSFHSNRPKLEDILLNHDLAKFGDAVVNFIYNMAIYDSQHKLQGIKVWDKCLAHACLNSPLKNYLKNQKKQGDVADAVEAFIGYLVLENRDILSHMISILSRHLNTDLSNVTNERELCTNAFTQLLLTICKEKNIGISKE